MATCLGMTSQIYSELAVNNTTFLYNGEHHQQIFGMAMGLPVSAVMANLIMEDFESKLSTKNVPWLPRFWVRCVDDTFVIEHRDHADLPEQLCQVLPRVKFTMEIEQFNKLPFIEVEVQ